MDEDDITPLEKHLEDLKDIDGFPKGDDEDILELSDPPYYTACPNPYIEEFIEEHGTEYGPEEDDYEKKPFVSDVSEGKYDPFYRLHAYPTKVPYKAIMRYILHYTKPGDLILDGFCGTGMTGVAAQKSGNPDEDYKSSIEKQMDDVTWGDRKAILNDLCPIATYISYVYLRTLKSDINFAELENIISDVVEETKWMFKTRHRAKNKSVTESNDFTGEINYTVWSDVLECPYCKNEYVFYDIAVEVDKGKIKKEYKCPSCNADITKKESNLVMETYFDKSINKEVSIAKQEPVLINYTFNKSRFEKKPDEEDLRKIEKINNLEIPYWYPTNRMPKGEEARRNDERGITHVHHFYTRRNLWVLSSLMDKVKNKDSIYYYILTKIAFQITKMYRYTYQSGTWGAGGGPLSGTLYIPSLHKEINIINSINNAFKKLKKFESNKDLKKNTVITTQSSTNLSQIPSEIIDYIFVDPPFGKNLMYSELNFIWESWLRSFTNNKNEAIINESQNKDLNIYENLMEKCFEEFYRVLKPNRWITIEFHNSKASVWNSIRESINRAGFIIGQVSILDKQKGSFKQATSAGSVKNDLIINAYKPNKEFEEKFIKNSGKGMEVNFLRQQLKHIPTRPNVERTENMLYSKMLAHYVENGFKVQYDSTEFYNLLKENFVELDGYWFLEEQVEEYNEWKGQLSLQQLEEKLDKQQKLLVTDEKSALNWLKNFLKEPKEYSEIYTAFQQVLTQSEDEIPELKELLDNNFILEEGKYRKPQTEEEKKKAQESRRKELDKEFKKIVKEAREGSTKIKNVRKEALIHGFTKLYQEERYEEILEVADRLYKSTLESSGDIMDFVDIAEMKTSDKKNIEDY